MCNCEHCQVACSHPAEDLESLDGQIIFGQEVKDIFYCHNCGSCIDMVVLDET